MPKTRPEALIQSLEEEGLAMPLNRHDSGLLEYWWQSLETTDKSDLSKHVFKPLLRKANHAAIIKAIGDGTEPVRLPDVRCHDLRHTHATTLLRRGHSIKAISQRLGQSNIKITLEVYAHVLAKDDATLAEGLDRMFG
jgi:integrase